MLYFEFTKGFAMPIVGILVVPLVIATLAVLREMAWDWRARVLQRNRAQKNSAKEK